MLRSPNTLPVRRVAALVDDRADANGSCTRSWTSLTDSKTTMTRSMTLTLRCGTRKVQVEHVVADC